MQQKKILLIDDSTFSRNVLKRALEPKYQILEAGSGLAGIELFMTESPDLVILDVTMPDMNGIEVLEKLRQIDPSAQVILGSADVQVITRQQAEERGALGFMEKPFTFEDIQSAVQNALEVKDE